MVDTKPKFPMVFDKCPSCGSEERIANSVLKSEQANGKLKDVKAAFLFQQQSLIAPQNMRFLSAPMIMTFYDACAKCGTVFCVFVDVRLALPQLDKMHNKDIGVQHMS